MENIEEIVNNCLGCPSKPCQKGCPLNNDTTGFISLVKKKEYKEAFELLSNTTVLSAVCGKICPNTKQCQGLCIRNNIDESVEIGKIESFIGDIAIKENYKIPMFTMEKKNKKVAVIGGGPCGLTCSAFLARNGYDVTIFEKYDSLGGILKRGIPEFRLDSLSLEGTINKILDLGINVKYNTELGKDITLEELEKSFDAIFLSFGKNISSKMGIDGEDLKNVFGANELLETKKYPDFKDKKVAIIGGRKCCNG